jgi:hypothetical protein
MPSGQLKTELELSPGKRREAVQKVLETTEKLKTIFV